MVFGSNNFQDTRGLKFIQLQLLELARNCGREVNKGLVSPHFFLELENRLDKLLYETRAICCPPLVQPDMSDFDRIKRISSGGFGTVNLVRHRETGQAFALKQIKRNGLTCKPTLENVLNERDILTYTDHPFVATMLCSFESDKGVCMLMEFVGGGDCHSLLKRLGCLPIELAQLYTAETICAVEYLHSFGILHGDIKPRNLLISSTGHIKVTDFGLSKIGAPMGNMVTDRSSIDKIVREFNDGVMAGTLHYIAPEVYQMSGYGKPIDWWAVGVTLYQFLVGTYPFYGDTDDDLVNEIMEKQVTWPRDTYIPFIPKNLVTRLLQKNPENRLGTRGANEVKGHQFFKKINFKKLLDQTPLFVPQLDNEEDTRYFGTQTIHSSEYNYDDSSFVELPYICSVAYRFRKVYGSPMPLASYGPFRQRLQAKKTQHRPVREEREQQEVDVRFKNKDPKDPAVPRPEKAENGEVSQVPEDPIDAQEPEDQKDPQDTEEPQDAQDVQHTEGPEDSEVPQDTEKSQDTEDPKVSDNHRDTEGPQDVQDIIVSQDIMNPKDIVDSHDTENQGTKESQDTENAMDPMDLDPHNPVGPRDSMNCQDIVDLHDTEGPQDIDDPQIPEDPKYSQQTPIPRRRKRGMRGKKGKRGKKRTQKRKGKKRQCKGR